MSVPKNYSGNNMPVQSPLVPNPLVPYYCKNSTTASVLVEFETDSIKRYLTSTPFDYVDDYALIYVNDFRGSEKLPYMDGGIILHSRFENVTGGYYIFEYEDNDAAIAAGRELWGYPKKFGKMTLDRRGSEIQGRASRNDEELIRIRIDLSQSTNTDPVPEFSPFPHLNIHTIPNPDGPGIFSQRIISRDNSMDCTTISKEFGSAEVDLFSTVEDPLGDLVIKKVHGGIFSVTDFAATNENGWGTVISTLV